MILMDTAANVELWIRGMGLSAVIVFIAYMIMFYKE